MVAFRLMDDSRREEILGHITDLVLDFLCYDRKEDEDLPMGEIEAAVRAEEISVREMAEAFFSELSQGIAAERE